MGPGNAPAVWVWTRKTFQFGSRPIQKADLLLLGGRNPAPYPWTHRFYWVWLDLSGPISGFPFWVVLVMVTFRYPTLDRIILTMVCHCSFWMYWLPVWSKNVEQRSLPHPGNECQQSVTNLWFCIQGNLSGHWLQIVITEVLASFKGERRSDTLLAPSSQWESNERQWFKVSHLA